MLSDKVVCILNSFRAFFLLFLFFLAELERVAKAALILRVSEFIFLPLCRALLFFSAFSQHFILLLYLTLFFSP